MTRKFAISDIHGCLQSFKALLEQLDLQKTDQLYLLGDYIDRGPDSKGVIDYIWHLQEAGYEIYCLQGNHDVMLLRAAKSFTDNISWMQHGGEATLKSFGVERATDIPRKYLSFLERLPQVFEIDNYILVHAGLNFRIPDPLEDAVSMLWIRDWYQAINYNWLGERYIIHGHTPMLRKDIETMHADFKAKRVLDIDGGCFFDIPGMGFLSALELGTHRIYWQPTLDGSRKKPVT